MFVLTRFITLAIYAVKQPTQTKYRVIDELVTKLKSKS